MISNLEAIPSQNNVFPTPFLRPKPPRASPGPISKSWVQILVPGSKNEPSGPKTKKMRAEKPCRTPPPEFQKEPYGASYGQKPFWGKPSQTRLSQGVPRGPRGSRCPGGTRGGGGKDLDDKPGPQGWLRIRGYDGQGHHRITKIAK